MNRVRLATMLSVAAAVMLLAGCGGKDARLADAADASPVVISAQTPAPEPAAVQTPTPDRVPAVDTQSIVASAPAGHSAFESIILAAIREKEREIGCRIGLSYRDRDLPLRVEHNGDVLFHPASTMKVAVMIEIFRQADEGRYSVDDKVVVNANCRSMLDGSPFVVDARPYLQARIGQPETIVRIVEEMIQVSDNLATNMLIERAGARNITAMMRLLGAKDGFVIRGLQDIPAFNADISNRMTPNDLTTLMEAIDRGQAASPESCAEMKRILLGQRYRDMIPAQLPEAARVANKTGSITGHRHDTAIVEAPFGAWYLTILVDGLRGNNAAAGSRAAAEISRLIWDERAKVGQ